MGRRCGYWSGVALIVLALGAVPSVPVITSYAGGSAVWRGHVGDGRYFVAPGHGKPVAEVSGALWRTVYWTERLWPWSAVVPGLLGLFLTGAERWSDGRPPPAAPPEPPPGFLGACAAVVAVTAAGVWTGWRVTGAAWVVWVVGWVLFCAGSWALAWYSLRFWRRAADAEPGAAPDRRGASG